MAVTTYTGTGTILDTDYKDVAFKGFTKSGKYIMITVKNAVNLGNIDWTFADKGEMIPQTVFTGTYSNTDAMSESTVEPFEIECEDDTLKGAKAILLGAGQVLIGGKPAGLTRGGSQFTVERTTREIEADGDRGPVKGRVVIDRSVPKLTINLMEIIDKLSDLYPGLTKSTSGS